MGFWNYEYKRVRHVFSDYRQFINKMGFISHFFLVGISLLFYWRLEGFEAMIDKWETFIAYTLGPVAGLSLCVLIWNYITAPSRMEQENTGQIGELRDHNKKLEEQLITKQKGETIGLKLTAYFHVASNLSCDRTIDNEAKFNAWATHVDRWGTRLVDYIHRNISSQDAEDIRHTQADIRKKYVYAFNDEHNRQLHFLSVRMEKLKELMKQFIEPINLNLT